MADDSGLTDPGACLIVDTTPIVRKVATRILLEFGFVTEAAASVEEANAFLASDRFVELALIGSEARDEAAEALVQAIRRRAGGRETRIIAVITESNLGLMTRLRRAGVDGYLLKPFVRDDLVRTLETIPRRSDRAA